MCASLYGDLVLLYNKIVIVSAVSMHLYNWKH